MVGQEYPFSKAESNVKGADPQFLQQVKNEKCHLYAQKTDITKLANEVIQKLQNNAKRVAPELKNVENYHLERRLQAVRTERLNLKKADKVQILSKTD